MPLNINIFLRLDIFVASVKPTFLGTGCFFIFLVDLWGHRFQKQLKNTSRELSYMAILATK